MKSYKVDNCTLLEGDCREGLKTLPDKSVHCVVTSPPYWGLRDYRTGEWEGGDTRCDHKKDNNHQKHGHNSILGEKGKEERRNENFRSICEKCGARRIDQQVGNEISYQKYVCELVEIFREIKRVLRDDGVVWLNLGDTYAVGGHMPEDYGKRANKKGHRGPGNNVIIDGPMQPSGLPDGNLTGIPWRVAFALQADGWILRQDIVWSKPNPMTESVQNRCTKSHEYIFLFAKKKGYYFDNEAIKEKMTHTYKSSDFIPKSSKDQTDRTTKKTAATGASTNNRSDAVVQDRRNKRTVWEVPVGCYKGSHFATYPIKLILPCVKAGTSHKGCCSQCGTPWKRVVESDRRATRPGKGTKVKGNGALQEGNRDPQRHCTESRTIGWEPSCDCKNAQVIPCTVLDPFSGAATTGLACQKTGRSYIGIELNPEYLQMSLERLRSRGHAHGDTKKKRADINTVL